MCEKLERCVATDCSMRGGWYCIHCCPDPKRAHKLRIDAYEVCATAFHFLDDEEELKMIIFFPECNDDPFVAIQQAKKTWNSRGWLDVKVNRCDKIIYTPYYDDDELYDDPQYKRYLD